ncbi:hypothetical protein JZU61_04370 [bacterium]|jgi:hypothetical protein|nr:hypothetical protein [bacterium]
MKYDNLKQKTIFDLTEDKEILDQIVAPGEKDFFLQNMTDNERAVTFLELADLTGDTDLEKATMEQFKDVLKKDE